MKNVRLELSNRELVRRLSRRDVVRDGLIAGGLLAAAPWLIKATGAQAQDLATPVAVPGSAGEIGRPETVPIDHLVVIFLENRPFDHLYGLFPGANGLLSPGAEITRPMQMGFRTHHCRRS